MKTLYNMNNVYNTSQNDWLSASKAVGFSHHDPNRYSNNASGFEFKVPPSIGGNGVPNQDDWLSATKANGFSHLLHGGRSLGMSKVGQEDGTNFMPRGNNIYGSGKITLADTADEIINDSGNTKIKTKDTEFIPRGSDTTLPQKGGASGTSTSTPFEYTKLYTGNYNMPSVKGAPILYGNTTLGLVPDLGTNLQPLRQAYFHSGL